MGQHEVALREIMDSLQNLTTSVSQLGGRMDQVSTHLSTLSAPAPPAPVPTPAPTLLQSSALREPFIPTPAMFSGMSGSCRQFLHQCSLVFGLQPSSYFSDRAKVAFIMGHLSDKASAWPVAMTGNHSPICNNYQLFTSEMLRVFDHPLQGRESGARLLSLRQGSSSVAQFSIDFPILSAESGWGEKALQSVSLRSLSDEVRDELAVRDELSGL